MSVLAHCYPHYNHPSRAYHNLFHIGKVLDYAYLISGEPLTKAQYFAIWYHDVIYDPTELPLVNETKSIKFMKDRWTGIISDSVLTVASEIIAATSHIYRSIEKEREVLIVLDADLAGLGEPSEIYNYAARNIRNEYCHLSDIEWATVRTRFLKSMLCRESIFHLKESRDLFEKQAILNINKELKDLEYYGYTQ